MLDHHPRPDSVGIPRSHAEEFLEVLHGILIGAVASGIRIYSTGEGFTK
jgi:hypothetical protein